MTSLKRVLAYLAAALLTVFAGALPGATTAAQGAPHLPSTLDVSPPAAFSSASAIDPGEPWTFGLILPSADAAGLEAYAQSVSEPSSPNYRHFLTAAQTMAAYGPSAQTVSALTAYLSQRGFTTALDGQILQVSGTVGQVDALFATHLVAIAPPPERRALPLPSAFNPTVAPDSPLTIPDVLRAAAGITGLVRDQVSPLGTATPLGRANVALPATGALPGAPTGTSTQASSGPFTVKATLLTPGSVEPGMVVRWLLTATLDGAPDASAQTTSLATTSALPAYAFWDSTPTTAAGQWLVGTTAAESGVMGFVATVSDGTNSVQIALPAANFFGPNVATCNLVGTPTVCPYNPTYNSLNAAYGATGVAGLPATRGRPTIAVFTAGAVTAPSVSDVDTFAKTFGLPAPAVTVAYAGADACQPTNSQCAPYLQGYEVELSLDLQMLETSSPAASIQVYESSSLREALNAVVQQDSARVFSISYGAGEMAEYAYDSTAQSTWDLLAQEATVEGITITVAAGDSGGYGGAEEGLTSPMPSYPANSPWVSALGATETAVLPTHAIGQSALWAGNLGAELSTSTLLSFLELTNMMGGGGISQLEAEPAYQAATRAETGRLTPDYSYAGSVVTPGILAFFGGQLYLFGGTSAAAPLFAGWIADMGQGLGHALGNVNTAIYASARSDASLLMPIAYGNNGVYAVTPGLNAVTGLGSLNVGRLYADLGGASSPPPSPLPLPPPFARPGGPA